MEKYDNVSVLRIVAVTENVHQNCQMCQRQCKRRDCGRNIIQFEKTWRMNEQFKIKIEIEIEILN